MLKGHLDEIFFSIQGEGGELGRPHIFCRVGGCPLRCSYCDTPESWNKKEKYALRVKNTVELLPNPVSVSETLEQLEQVLAAYGLKPIDCCLSITGGEPLEQSEFCLILAESWPGLVLLETAGTSVESLKRLALAIDIVSLDWKIDSLVKAGEGEYGQCLEYLFSEKIQTQVKLVVSRECTNFEVEDSSSKIANCYPGIETFLQPVTPRKRGPQLPSEEQLLEWLIIGHSLNLDLRVVPQTHPILNVR